MGLRFSLPASVVASPQKRSFALDENAPRPAELLEHLTQGVANNGALLLESSDGHNGQATRSLLLPEPLLRLRSQADLLVVEALTTRGQALLAMLGERLAGFSELKLTQRSLHARAPDHTAQTGLPDPERLMQPSILDAVRALVTLIDDALPITGALPIAVYGVFSFELAHRFEELPGRKADSNPEPDLNLVLALDGIEIDHRARRVTCTTRALLGNEEFRAADERIQRFAAAPLKTQRKPTLVAQPNAACAFTERCKSDFGADEYQHTVRRILEHIQAGDVFQTVLSRQLTVASSAPPLAVYRALRQLNPSPYMFHFDLGDGVLLGASPECCVQVTGRELRLQPIAGTVPRGFTKSGAIDAELDMRLATSLLLDPKEQAEHAMLVDLARNDVARVAQPGTREVREPFRLVAYSHVQHLVSSVVGTLAEPFDALDAYRACANMGTLTGAPKLRAMELIAELEPTARGTYGGALGFLTRDGDFDSCIVIRALRFADGVYTIRSGAGIVAASVPEHEFNETLHKAQAALQALQVAEQVNA